MNGPKDLFWMSGVSQSWFDLFAYPHRWTHMVRTGCLRKFLVYPDFQGILESFAVQGDLATLARVIMEFSKDQEVENRFDSFKTSLNLYDGPYLKLVYGSVKRIQVLWQHLPNKNPGFNLGGNDPHRKYRYWFLTHFYSL